MTFDHIQANTFFKILLSLTLSISLVSVASAEDYTHGNGALQVFDAQGFENSPQWVKIWVGIMSLSFVAGLFFVWKHPIARWVVGGMLAGMLFGIIAKRGFGVVELSGFIALVHVIFWSPALYQLLSKRPFLGPKTPFAIWSGIMTAVILFSFVFDIRDAAIYLGHIL